MALFAHVILFVEALWAVLHTQLGALELQQRRWTGPAGRRPWSRTELTGLVTFLTVGAIYVKPEEIHKMISITDVHINYFYL